MGDYHFADQDMVFVKNRTSQELSVTYNGRSVTIPVNGGRWMTPVAAIKAIEQNRVMGTEDPLNPGHFDSLVYVEGSDMPSTPIEQSDRGEALDRSLMPPERQSVRIRQRNTRRMRGDVIGPREETLGAHFAGSRND